MRTFANPTASIGPNGTVSGAVLDRPGSILVAQAVPAIFVIPAYNEEENLPRLFADLESRPGLFTAHSRILVVNDGSTDETAAIVSSYDGPLPVELVDLERNQGPGGAFRAGFAAALDGCPEDALIVTLEADTTSDLDALPGMLARACDGADLVLASWVMVNVSPLRRILSERAGSFVRAALGVQATTVSSFFRVYRAGLLRDASARYGSDLIREPGFACKAEILAKVAALGARIEEVPVGLDSSRRIGKSKMPIFRTMLAYWRMCARQRSHRRAPAT
jgi:glycosyltransferase involved in cell wall biosynthesis